MAAKAWDAIFGISEDLKDEDMHYLRKKQHVLLHTTIRYNLNLWVKYSNYLIMSSIYCYTLRNFKHFSSFLSRIAASFKQHLNVLRLASY